MAFAVNPPQFIPIQQTAIVDKPLGKPVEPPKRPDVFDGVETDPYDIATPERKGKPELPKSAVPEAIKRMTKDMLFRQIELYGVKLPKTTRKEELQMILQNLLEDQPMTPSASSSSASASGKLQVTPASIRFLDSLKVAPRPPPQPTSPEEEKGPAQAFAGPPRRLGDLPINPFVPKADGPWRSDESDLIDDSPKEQRRMLKTDWTPELLIQYIQDNTGKSREEIEQRLSDIDIPDKINQKQVLKILREMQSKK
jgi:hypothetical protein